MKKSFCLSGLAVAFLGLGVVHGQGPAILPPAPVLNAPIGSSAPGGNIPQPPDPYDGIRGNPPAYNLSKGGPESPPTPGQPPAYPPGLTSWLTYPRTPGACGPVGGNGPIRSELYLRSGVSFPVGGGIFGDVLHPGWGIQGGARVLFFDLPADGAWALDLSISNVNYNATNSTRHAILRDFPVQNPGPTGAPTTTFLPEFPVTVAGLNQTFVNLAVGREWYLWGPGDGSNGGPNLRWGLDGGGRYGTARLELNEIRHRTDVVGGVFIAVHADYQYPCGACILFAGVRGEYGITWSDILQPQNDTNLQTLNLLFSFGLQY